MEFEKGVRPLIRCNVCGMKHFLVAAALAIGVQVSADPISTLATGATQGPLEQVAKAFQQESGHQVTIQFDTSQNIARRLAGGERPDVLIASVAGVDQAIKEGKAVAGTRLPVGKIGIGVAIPRGARRPDLSSADALKASIRQADAVVMTQGASAAFVDRMFADMGIAEEIKPKVVRVPTGAAVMQRLGAARTNELGFTMISELKFGEAHGGVFVGALPAAVQTLTSYDAVVMTGAASAEAARAFVRAIGAAPARKLLAAAGWEF
jgi:molybdate transport system substrate-binding protein